MLAEVVGNLQAAYVAAKRAATSVSEQELWLAVESPFKSFGEPSTPTTEPLSSTPSSCSGPSVSRSAPSSRPGPPPPPREQPGGSTRFPELERIWHQDIRPILFATLTTTARPLAVASSSRRQRTTAHGGQVCGVPPVRQRPHEPCALFGRFWTTTASPPTTCGHRPAAAGCPSLQRVRLLSGRRGWIGECRSRLCVSSHRLNRAEYGATDLRCSRPLRATRASALRGLSP